MALSMEWTRRIEHWRKAMPGLFFRPLAEVRFEGYETREALDAAAAARGRFRPMPPGTRWGPKWTYAWFRADVAIPKSAAGERVVLRPNLGRGEMAVYVDGVNAGGVDGKHREITLARKARGGERFRVLIEAYAGHGRTPCGGGPAPDGIETVPEPPRRQAEVGVSEIGLFEEGLFQLWMDAETLWRLREAMADKESLRVAAIDDGLKAMTLAVDLELPRAEMLESVRAGRRLLRPLLAARNGSTPAAMHCFGHSHIDVAWLWPLRETESKCARTFGTQLALMAEYPEFRFLQSQTHLYDMVRRRDPRLYARIRDAVRRGQWIADGGMWVEPDTNLAGGESLIRQFLHGKRFFREQFGVESELMWLPDVFGYSAALPQIMAGCGIRHFSTQKIFWTYNGGDPFPHNLFWWEGLDGTRVLACIHNDYNSEVSPRHVIERWNERVQKDTTHPVRLMPFGWGDGGGGPTREHLEYLRRLRDLEGCPRCRIAAPADYFRSVDTRALPVYVGELYFQAHRGTYTTQSRTKQGNRRCELALREAELWGAAARALAGFRWPRREAEGWWRQVLLNQFHDILPGSSIARVYEQAEQGFAEILAAAGACADAARGSLAKRDATSLTVFNSLSWPREARVELPRGAKAAFAADGAPLPCQRSGGRTWALVPAVPSCGWMTIRTAAAAGARAAATAPAPAAAIAADDTLENEFLRVRVNRAGEIVSVRDRETGGEWTAGPCNRFRLYKDVPSSFDAWDIDSMYRQQPVPIAPGARIERGAAGPLVASLVVTRAIGRSTLRQEIALPAGRRRIEFRTTIDWRERHKLLKVEFPVSVRAEDALHEVQFGHVRRPTHASRPYDAQRFEVCQHKWTALAEEARGAALLNDGKYGINVEGSSMNLTLLRSSLAPDMRADLGRHAFAYALYCWNGPFAESGVVREGYELNIPATTAPGDGGEGSLLAVDAPNVVVETVKPAEDGSGDVVVRLYESARTATACRVRANWPAARVVETDLLETRQRPLPARGGAVALRFRPFEIKTLRFVGPAAAASRRRP